MKGVAIVTLIFGIVAAVFAGYQVSLRLEEAEKVSQTEFFLQLSPRLNAPVRAGETLAESQIVKLPLPVNADTKGMIQSTALPSRSDTIALATVRPLARTISPGELLTFDLFDTVEQPRLDSVVLPNRRAITVSVDQRASLNGQIAPGNRIDVAGVFESEGVLVAEELLSDVGVIAVGDYFSYDEWQAAGSPGYSTLTLDVSSGEGLMMAARRPQMIGGVVVMLRNQCDTANPSPACE